MFLHEAGQAGGKRRAVIILTYEDRSREDYREVAQRLAYCFSWFGDFGEVVLFVEGGFGPADAVTKRPGLLAKARKLGQQRVADLQ